MHFKMSSAICFSLDQSKMLPSGNRLTSNCSQALATMCKAFVYLVHRLCQKVCSPKGRLGSCQDHSKLLPRVAETAPDTGQHAHHNKAT